MSVLDSFLRKRLFLSLLRCCWGYMRLMFMIPLDEGVGFLVQI